MIDNPLFVAVLFAGAIFFFLIFIAALSYQSEAKNRRHKDGEEDWLLGNMSEKLYSAFFGTLPADDVAATIGISTEKYYRSCRLTKNKPNVKKLVINYIYGFLLLILFFIFGIIIDKSFFLFGGAAFCYFSIYQQRKLNRKAEKMKVQIETELPRFLDLLIAELQVGLPIESAISILCNKMDTLLSEEFKASLNEMQIGASDWQKALENMAERYDVEVLSDFVLNITTAYSRGVSIVDTVMRNTKEIKDKTILRAKERAGKATNTILVPTAIFELLPMMAFFLFPTVISMRNGFF